MHTPMLALLLSLMTAAAATPRQPPASTSGSGTGSAGTSAAASATGTIRAPHAEIVVAPLEAAAADAPVLRVSIRPRAGIHIYAPGQRGYYPVALTLPPDTGLTADRVDLPAPEPYVFTPTGEKFLVYQQPFTLTQYTRRARRGTVARSGTVRGVRATLRYQACDAEVCYRPVELPIVFSPPAPHGGAAADKR